MNKRLSGGCVCPAGQGRGKVTLFPGKTALAAAGFLMEHPACSLLPRAGGLFPGIAGRSLRRRRVSQGVHRPSNAPFQLPPHGGRASL